MSENSTHRAKIAWLLFDIATIPFFVLILIFVFAPYFVAHVAPDPINGQKIWGYTVAIAGLIVAIAAPLLGAIADKTGHRKLWIAGFSVMIVTGLIPLYFAVPGDDSRMIITLGSLVLAFVGVRLATTFNNAMLPQIVSAVDVGRYSGFGTAIGNLGGLILIIFVLGFMAADEDTGKTLFGLKPILGLDASTFQGERATAILSAAWFCIFITPLFLFAPDTKPVRALGNPVRAGMSQLLQTIKTLPNRTSYLYFLVAVMFYRTGISSLYVFGGIYAASVLDLPITIVGIFGIVAILFGAIGGVVGGLSDRFLGPMRIVQLGCIILALDCLLFVSTTKTTVMFLFAAGSKNTLIIVYLAAGAIAGLASNAVQAASRTLLVQQVDVSEATEAFGLYDLASRATAFTGPFAVGFLTQISGSQRVGIVPIILFLIVGVLFLSKVNNRK